MLQAFDIVNIGAFCDLVALVSCFNESTLVQDEQHK